MATLQQQRQEADKARDRRRSARERRSRPLGLLEAIRSAPASRRAAAAQRTRRGPGSDPRSEGPVGGSPASVESRGSGSTASSGTQASPARNLFPVQAEEVLRAIKEFSEVIKTHKDQMASDRVARAALARVQAVGDRHADANLEQLRAAQVLANERLALLKEEGERSRAESRRERARLLASERPPALRRP